MNKITVYNSAYSKLVLDLKNEIAQGLVRAQEAYDKEKIITYWKVGSAIHKHFLENKIQAEFGKQIFKNLSKDLNIGERLLYQMTGFYKAYPNFDPSINLKWTHYRLLSSLKDEKHRNTLEQQVLNENLTSRHLESRIQNYNSDVPGFKMPTVKKKVPVKLRPIRGKMFHYNIFKNKFSENYFVDYGFRIYKETNLKNFDGSFARGIKNGEDDFSFVRADIQKKYIFTYKAYIADVIDADTIWVVVDLGFRAWTKQKIRFRGIDAPEKDSPDFEASRQFVIKRFKNLPFLVIKSFYPDLYDRWLSDIFYLPGEPDPQVVLEKGRYINQELLDEGIVRPFEKDRNKTIF